MAFLNPNKRLFLLELSIILFCIIPSLKQLHCQTDLKRLESLKSPLRYCAPYQNQKQWLADSARYTVTDISVLKPTYPVILQQLADQYIQTKKDDRASYLLHKAAYQCQLLGHKMDSIYWHIQTTRSMSQSRATDINAVVDSIQTKFGTAHFLWRRAQYFKGLKAYLAQDYPSSKKAVLSAIDRSAKTEDEIILTNMARNILSRIIAKEESSEVAMLMLDSLITKQQNLNIQCDPFLFSWRLEYSSRLIENNLPQIAQRQIQLAEQSRLRENEYLAQYEAAGQIALHKAQLAKHRNRQQEAIAFYLIAESHSLKLPEGANKTLSLLPIYNGLGSLYAKQGQWVKAAAAYEYAMDLIRPAEGAVIPPNFIALSINQAAMYHNAQQYEKALEGNHRAKTMIIQRFGEGHYYEAVINNNLGDTYLEMGDISKARLHYKKSLELRQQIYSPKNPKTITAYESLGKLAEKEQAFNESVNYHRLALESCTDNFGLSSGSCYKNYLQFAAALIVAKQLHKAQEVLNDLEAYYPANGPTDNMRYRLHRKLLTAKLYYQKSQSDRAQPNFSLLDSACYFVSHATKLLDSIQFGYNQEVAKAALIAHNLPLYQLGIAVAYDQYEQSGNKSYLQTAWTYAARLKYNLQWQYRREQEARYKEELIPATASDSLKYYEEQLLNKAHSTKSKLALLRQYDNYRLELSERFPSYQAYRYVLPLIDWEALEKESIETATDLIELFIDDAGYLHAFKLSNGELSWERQFVGIDIEQKTRQLIQHINQQRTFEHASENYAFAALLEKLIITNGAYPKHLRIIPQGIFNQFSFAGLPLQQGGWLAAHSTISYGWSIFDPLTKSVPSLKHALFIGSSSVSIDQELTALNKLFKVVQPATVTNAFEQLAEEDISQWMLHFSGHGVVSTNSNERLPYIDFSPSQEEEQLLTIEEICKHYLPLPLVSLGACQTGNGPYQSGEGNRSIADAFSRSGAEAILMTLWDVPDASSAYILAHFYKFLAAGNDKATALQLAQLSYQQNSMDSRSSNPYYWAGFVIIGDNTPVNISSSGFDCWWLIIGFGLVVLILYLLKVFKLL